MQISAISSYCCNLKCKEHTVEKFWNDCYTDLVRTFVIENLCNQAIVGTTRDARDPLVVFRLHFHRGENGNPEKWLIVENMFKYNQQNKFSLGYTAVYRVIKSTESGITYTWNGPPGQLLTRTQKKIFNLRLSFPKYKMGVRIPTMLLVLYVVLNTDKTIGTWSHTVNYA